MALHWVCSLYSRDAKGERVIKDPEMKKLDDAVLGFKQNEVTSEHQPTPNKDALEVVLVEDHNGRVCGFGGVRLGKRKGLRRDMGTSRNSTPKQAPDMEKRVEELVSERFKLLCDKLGMPNVSSHFKGEVQDKSSKHALRTNSEKERP